MLNYETILSSYDDKMTLMQWLKKVEEALKHASATAFRVNKKGNATISFILDFEDGTTLESGDIVLQQGESVNGAYIQNGHLFITLTNDQIIDAGVLLGTNLNIEGEITANTIKQRQFNFTQAFNLTIGGGLSITNIYNRFAEINNVLHVIVNFAITNNSGEAKIIGSGYNYLGFTSLTLPTAIANKIVDIDGKLVSDADAVMETLIASEPAQALKQKILTSQSIFYNARISLVNRSGANGCSIVIALNGNTTDRVTIEDGETIYVTARMALTLI